MEIHNVVPVVHWTMEIFRGAVLKPAALFFVWVVHGFVAVLSRYLVHGNDEV